MAQKIKPQEISASKQSGPAAQPLQYMSGFGNHFATEARTGALPIGQNSPQQAPLGLYAEQLSGTAFSALRHENQRSWLYRIRPSVIQGDFRPISAKLLRGRPFNEVPASPNQYRWSPMPFPQESVDFIDGLATICGNGDSASLRGCATHIYTVTASMGDKFFYNSDGEFLIVPQLGTLIFRTEFGILDVKPGEIAVIPRGVRYTVDLIDGPARGYVLENYGPALRLPYLSIVGANGMANTRDFETPCAAFEAKVGKFQLINKYHGSLFEADLGHSPLDVVAWHGNYAPYKYDLAKFAVINSVSFDHPDPSIFTVLTSPSEVPGVANIDFVIFPPRWTVAEGTFRPPYYHRNAMSEYMGLVFGVYDAKEEGFLPGGGSLHNCMSAHGPDSNTYNKASTADLKPAYLGDTLAFMFETSLPFQNTKFAMDTPILQKDYLECWQDIKVNFKDV